ncbi:MAG: L-seryl-tRNA(Sec) selenium transferase [Candidatus Hydrogenedentota bacterium]
MKKEIQNSLRALPKMDTLLASEHAEKFLQHMSLERLTEEVRIALDTQREQMLSGALGSFSDEELWSHVSTSLNRSLVPSLDRVINGTGVILHTNLGRAPLSIAALGNIAALCRGYSNVEFDIKSGQRGSRYVHVESLLTELTGAESALVVNNNAAAVMLVVNTLAKDGEVVTSRGELIEIGGSFRIPDVIERSEADLVEVGTTNKTRVGDFEAATTDKTRILLKVHPSNYRVVGFTEETPREALVELAKDKGIWSVEDLGSGTFIDTAEVGLEHEPTPREVLATGMDIVTFSGDKLLGGPQAGIIVGKSEAIDRMKKNPLLRALRMDKLTLAALESTLREYRDPERAKEKIPVLRMLYATAEQLQENANTLAEKLSDIQGISVEVINSESYSGGGALPQEVLPSRAITIVSTAYSPNALADALRNYEFFPVIGHIHNDRFTLDLRTLFDFDYDFIAAALTELHV